MTCCFAVLFPFRLLCSSRFRHLFFLDFLESNAVLVDAILSIGVSNGCSRRFVEYFYGILKKIVIGVFLIHNFFAFWFLFRFRRITWCTIDERCIQRRIKCLRIILFGGLKIPWTKRVSRSNLSIGTLLSFFFFRLLRTFWFPRPFSLELIGIKRNIGRWRIEIFVRYLYRNFRGFIGYFYRILNETIIGSSLGYCFFPWFLIISDWMLFARAEKFLSISIVWCCKLFTDSVSDFTQSTSIRLTVLFFLTFVIFDSEIVQWFCCLGDLLLHCVQVWQLFYLEQRLKSSLPC